MALTGYFTKAADEIGSKEFSMDSFDPLSVEDGFNTDLDSVVSIDTGAPSLFESFADAINPKMAMGAAIPAATIQNKNQAKQPSQDKKLTRAGMKDWKPASTIKADAGGKISQSEQKAAGAKTQDAAQNIGKLKQQDIDARAAAQAPDQNAGVSGMAKGFAFDVAITGALTAISPMAGAAYASISMAKDAGHIMQALTGQGTQVTFDQATTSTSISNNSGASKQSAVSYMNISDTQGYGGAATSVQSSTLAKMSQGPGFGKAPTSITEADADYAHDTLGYASTSLQDTPEMRHALSTLGQGIEETTMFTTAQKDMEDSLRAMAADNTAINAQEGFQRTAAMAAGGAI